MAMTCMSSWSCSFYPQSFSRLSHNFCNTVAYRGKQELRTTEEQFTKRTFRGYFYRPQKVWGNVMFLHMSVILSAGGGGDCLPSMYHRSHDQRSGFSIHEGSSYRWRGSASKGGVCIWGTGVGIQGRVCI